MVAERSVTASKVSKKPGKKKLADSASMQGGDGDLVLGGNLCIPEINSLREQLSSVLQADGAIVIDAAAVEAADTATLQLLTAFVNAARGQSRSVEWRSSSAILQDVARSLDLGRHLGLSSESATASVVEAVHQSDLS